MQRPGWIHALALSVADCMRLNLAMGRRTDPRICCVGVSVSTSALKDGERERYLGELARQTGLPCIDPLIAGCAASVETVRKLP